MTDRLFSTSSRSSSWLASNRALGSGKHNQLTPTEHITSHHIILPPKMSNSQQQKQLQLPFSVDLAVESGKHLDFLQKLHKLGVTLERPCSAESVRRYAELWLPLVAEITGDRDGSKGGRDSCRLIPPPDVAWLWHCHRLAPCQYRRYIVRRFGPLSVVEATPPFLFQSPDFATNSEDEVFTRDAWKTMHPNESFYLPRSAGVSGDDDGKSDATDDFVVVDGFDLKSSVRAQSTLLWHVSGPRFSDRDFLVDGAERYYKFLKMKQENGVPLFPTYQVRFCRSQFLLFLRIVHATYINKRSMSYFVLQIDLMWHTHILCSTEQYRRDCISIRGEEFDHDDSFDDRSPGSEPQLAFEQTKRLLRQHYGEEYVVDGAMYHGEPPAEYYAYQTWKTSNDEHSLVPARPASISSTIYTESTAAETAETSAFGQLVEEKWKPLVAPYFLFESHSPAPKERDGYVFGCGTAGIGYYSLETREAYTILYARLQRLAAYRRSELETYDCTMCYVCLPWRQANDKERETLESRLKEVSDYVRTVRLRMKGDGPVYNSQYNRSSCSYFGIPEECIMLRPPMNPMVCRTPKYTQPAPQYKARPIQRTRTGGYRNT